MVFNRVTDAAAAVRKVVYNVTVGFAVILLVKQIFKKYSTRTTGIVAEGGRRFMAAWRKEDDRSSY